MRVLVARRAVQALLFGLALPLLSACGSSDGTGPGTTEPGNQTATASASPAAATVARGNAANVTIVFNATGGLVIGNSFTINRQYEGISVTTVSSVRSGSTITEVYSVGADATVPTGTHAVRFSTGVTGYTGTGPAASAVTATFNLTVTP